MTCYVRPSGLILVKPNYTDACSGAELDFQYDSVIGVFGLLMPESDHHLPNTVLNQPNKTKLKQWTNSGSIQ